MVLEKWRRFDCQPSYKASQVALSRVGVGDTRAFETPALLRAASYTTPQATRSVHTRHSPQTYKMTANTRRNRDDNDDSLETKADKMG